MYTTSAKMTSVQKKTHVKDGLFQTKDQFQGTMVEARDVKNKG